MCALRLEAILISDVVQIVLLAIRSCPGDWSLDSNIFIFTFSRDCSGFLSLRLIVRSFKAASQKNSEFRLHNAIFKSFKQFLRELVSFWIGILNQFICSGICRWSCEAHSNSNSKNNQQLHFQQILLLLLINVTSLVTLIAPNWLF